MGCQKLTSKNHIDVGVLLEGISLNTDTHPPPYKMRDKKTETCAHRNKHQQTKTDRHTNINTDGTDRHTNTYTVTDKETFNVSLHNKLH